MPRYSKAILVSLLVSLLFSLAIPNVAQEIPAKYMRGWREDPGLWGNNPQIRTQAWMLAAAGLDSVLGKINTTKVLQNLRIAQEKSGDRRGCFWWQWSDRRITDTNSGFCNPLPV